MTAQAGKHRTIRLPEDLVQRIDAVRHAVPRERWIRDALGVAVEEARHPLLRLAPDGSVAPVDAVSGRLEAEQSPSKRHLDGKPRLRLKRPEPEP